MGSMSLGALFLPVVNTARGPACEKQRRREERGNGKHANKVWKARN